MFTNFLYPQRSFDSQNLELMDRPQPVSSELLTDLQNLERLNRYFGSHALVLRFLKRWVQAGESIRIIDLCTGFGDIPRRMVDWCRKNAVTVRIAAIDSQASTLELAETAGYPEINFVRADVFEFEEPADLVFCSLALHHFPDDKASELVRRMKKMASRAVLVSDLERTDLAIFGIDLLTATLFRQPMTCHDARLSIRRAFSFREMHRLAEEAAWEQFGHARFPVCRQAIWLETQKIVSRGGR
jgi:SAM-dependent methyltransferase